MKPFLFTLLAIGTTALAGLYADNLIQGDDDAMAGSIFFSALSGGSLVISAVSVADAIADRRKKA